MNDATPLPFSSHLRHRDGRLPPAAVEALSRDLAARFGNKLVTSEAVREQHGHTLTWTANQPPDAVIFAEKTEDVVDAVKLCAKHDAPVDEPTMRRSIECATKGPREMAGRQTAFLSQGRDREEARENVLDALALMLSPEPDEDREHELLHLTIS